MVNTGYYTGKYDNCQPNTTYYNNGAFGDNCFGALTGANYQNSIYGYGYGTGYGCSTGYNFNTNYAGNNPLMAMFGGGNFFGTGSCGGGSPFTKCNGAIDWGKMLGSSLGYLGINLLTGIGGKLIKDHQETKKANSLETAESNLSRLNKEINSKLDELGVTYESQINSVVIDDKFTKAVSAANSEVEKLKAEIKNLPMPQESSADYIAKKTEYNNAKEKLEKQLKTAEAELTKAQEAQNKEQKRIDDLKAELKELIKERDEAKKIVNEKILDKADGKEKQQTKQDVLEAKFNSDTGALIDGQEITLDDVRGAIALYRVASDKEEEIKAAKLFNQCWKNMNRGDRTSDLRAARRIIPDQDAVVGMEASK